MKYGSLDWREGGVDRLAVALTQGGNENVFAYRFDWDEAGVVDGFDLGKALGASHAVEMSFVFGDFTTAWVMEDIYYNSAEKNVLADAMMSYWTQFALIGDPGKGRRGELPHAIRSEIEKPPRVAFLDPRLSDTPDPGRLDELVGDTGLVADSQ